MGTCCSVKDDLQLRTNIQFVPMLFKRKDFSLRGNCEQHEGGHQFIL